MGKKTLLLKIGYIVDAVGGREDQCYASLKCFIISKRQCPQRVLDCFHHSCARADILDKLQDPSLSLHSDR